MTNTYQFGKGSPLYVVNGGPGLEYSYLKEFFMPLTRERQIVFYDQLGTGASYDQEIQTTALELTRQLIELLRGDGKRKDVVTHSWGSYLALSALLEAGEDLGVDKLVCINPFALDYYRYQRSGERLLSRFPQTVLDQMEALAQENTKESYRQMMYLIAPYYTYYPEKEYAFHFESYNSRMEDGVYTSIAGFDHARLLPGLKSAVYIIKCEDDFISLDDTAELQAMANKYVVLPKCGHFPFIEQREECYRSLLSFLT